MVPVALVLCAGEAERWGNYRGKPKHLVPVDDGLPLLLRTVRQLRLRGLLPIVVSKPDVRYAIPGTVQYVPQLNPANYDADKFLSSRGLWCLTEKTTLVWGDVFFTDAAMDAVATCPADDWTMFHRPGPSQLTGKRYGEVFALVFRPEHVPEQMDALHRVVDLQRRGVTRRSGGWEFHKAMCGMSDSMLVDMWLAVPARRVIVDDFTEDFDVPQDYLDWQIGRGWLSGKVSA